MCCVRRTYCYSSGLQGRDNGGWAAPGGSGWTIRWLGGQLCCQTSSAASPCEPRCWQPSDSAGWGNQGSSREVAVWLWNWCSPHFQCYLPGGIRNTGPRSAAEPLETGSYHWLVKSQLSAAIIPLHRILYFTHCRGFARWKSWNGGHGASFLPEWHQYECMKFRTKEWKHVEWSSFYFTLLCLSCTSVLPWPPTYILAGEMYGHQLQLSAKHFKCY